MTRIGGVLFRSTWVEARDTAKHPTMHSIAPPTKIIWPTVPEVPRLKNSGIDWFHSEPEEAYQVLSFLICGRGMQDI